jgi:uncharacterized membrane protein
MYGSEFCSFSFWWIFPVLMVILCFVMMRRRTGSMMCGFGSCGTDSDRLRASDSTTEILDKRYASGEINKEEYDEKNEVLNQRN